MKGLMTRKLIVVSVEDTILHAVQLMRDSHVSSVLVVNSEGLVAGIITERDIVQKFTLLDVQDKLMAKAGVFMTRPVYVAQIDSLEADVKSLFFEKGIRHFPVVSSKDGLLSSVVGIMTVTDLASAWLKKGIIKNESSHEGSPVPVVVVCEDPKSREHYHKILKALQFDPVIEGQNDQLVDRACREHLPLLLDIDGSHIEKVKRYLIQLKGAQKNVFLLLSSQPELVQPLKEHLKGEGHMIVQKPLDIGYLLQLLQVTQNTRTLRGS